MISTMVWPVIGRLIEFDILLESDRSVYSEVSILMGDLNTFRLVL